MDSKECPINVAHATTFGKHWFLLFNDVFVHAGYASHLVHPLKTVWIESHQTSSAISGGAGNSPLSNSESKSGENPKETSTDDLEITLLFPEDNLTLVAQSHETKNEWIINLQRFIIESLGVNSEKNVKSFAPPILRHTSFNFTKVKFELIRSNVQNLS